MLEKVLPILKIHNELPENHVCAVKFFELCKICSLCPALCVVQLLGELRHRSAYLPDNH